MPHLSPIRFHQLHGMLSEHMISSNTTRQKNAEFFAKKTIHPLCSIHNHANTLQVVPTLVDTIKISLTIFLVFAFSALFTNSSNEGSASAN